MIISWSIDWQKVYNIIANRGVHSFFHSHAFILWCPNLIGQLVYNGVHTYKIPLDCDFSWLSKGGRREVYFNTYTQIVNICHYYLYFSANHAASLIYPAKFLNREQAVTMFRDVEVISQLRSACNTFQKQARQVQPTREDLVAANKWLQWYVCWNWAKIGLALRFSVMG